MRMVSRIKTLWIADLRSPPVQRPVRGGGLSHRDTPDLRFGGAVFGPDTREMLKWVLENVPDAEISADLQVTFRRETDAVAFRTRWE
ncbi:hypothetical protein GCM10008965_14720 [Methylorubrum aminovorans]